MDVVVVVVVLGSDVTLLTDWVYKDAKFIHITRTVQTITQGYIHTYIHVDTYILHISKYIKIKNFQKGMQDVN